MAVGSPREYTLVGFSVDLDWRPLRFVEPIEEYRICNVCGLVRKHSAKLPCGHVLCESCYRQCADATTFLCPLDGQRWPGEHAKWSTFPPEDLLNKKVKCWNEEYGCRAVLTARVVSSHFHHQCQSHSTRCPTCSSRVLCSHLCQHVMSGCRSPAAIASSRLEPSSLQRETDIVACATRAIRQEADKMMSYLANLISSSDMLCGRLDELSHGMNIFKESVSEQISENARILADMMRVISQGIDAIEEATTQHSLQGRSSEEEAFRQELVDAVRQCREDFLLLRRDLIVAIEQQGERLSSRGDVVNNVPNSARRPNSTSNPPRSSSTSSTNHAGFSQTAPDVPLTIAVGRNGQMTVDLNMTSCEFIVRGVKALENIAVTAGSVRYECEPVYLGGYLITPGVQFIKSDTIAIRGHLCMHKGVMNDVVRWPFQRKIKMIIKHPTNDEGKELEVKPYGLFLFYTKPEGSRHKGCCFPRSSLGLDVLVSGGYVEGDQLRVKWELLP